MSHSQGRRRDPALPQLGGMLADRRSGRFALIRQTIGKQNGATNTFQTTSCLMASKLTATRKPATAEVGATSGIDAGQRHAQLVSLAGADHGQTVHEIDTIVEHHQRGPVALVEHASGMTDRLLGKLDRATGHGTGSVDHESEVDGWAGWPVAGGRSRRDQSDHEGR